MSINKRVFGTPITGSVRDELQRRQSQGEIQFGDSLDSSKLNQYHELSSRTPFVRMWTSLKLIQPADMDKAQKTTLDKNQIDNLGGIEKAIDKYTKKGVTDPFGTEYTSPILTTKLDPTTNEVVELVILEENAREKIDFARKIYVIGNHEYQKSYGEVTENQSLTNPNTGEVVNNVDVNNLFPQELKNNNLLKPQSGITSVSVETQGSVGEIKKTIVKFLVHNFNDFDRIFNKYFLKPGATIFVDYGWSTVQNLYDPKDLIESMNDIGGIETFLYGSTDDGDENDGVITKNQSNLDVIQGIVQDFNAKILPNGSVDCEVTLVSSNSTLLNKKPDNSFSNRMISMLRQGVYYYTVTEYLKDILGGISVNDMNDTQKKQYEDLQKFLSTPTSITNTTDTVQYEESLINKALFLFKNKGLPSKSSVGSGIFIPSLSEGKDVYITWGLFEDVILNSQFGFGKNKTDVNKGKNFQVRMDSSNSFTTWNKDKSKFQAVQLNEKEKPDWLYPKWWEDGKYDDESGNSIDGKSYSFKEGKSPKRKDGLLLNNFATTDLVDQSKSRIPIREIFINVNVLITIFEKFKETTSIKKIINTILEKLSGDESNIFKWEIAPGDVDSQIKIIDKKFGENAQKTITEDEELDKLFFTFNIMSKNSFVKDYSLEMKIPEGDMAAQYALQGLSHDSSMIKVKKEHVDKLNSLYNLNDSQLSILYEPDTGDYNARQNLAQNNDTEAFNVYNTLDDFTLSPIDETDVNKPVNTKPTPKPKSLDFTINVLGDDVEILYSDNTSEIIAFDAFKAYTDGAPKGWQPKTNEGVPSPAPETKINIVELEKIIISNEKEEKLSNRIHAMSIRDYFDYELNGKISTPENEVSYFPYYLTLTIHGISSIQPGDTFRVDYLPKEHLNNSYLQTMQVRQELSPSGWFTTLETQYRNIFRAPKPDQAPSVSNKKEPLITRLSSRALANKLQKGLFYLKGNFYGSIDNPKTPNDFTYQYLLPFMKNIEVESDDTSSERDDSGYYVLKFTTPAAKNSDKLKFANNELNKIKGIFLQPLYAEFAYRDENGNINLDLKLYNSSIGWAKDADYNNNNNVKSNKAVMNVDKGILGSPGINNSIEYGGDPHISSCIYTPFNFCDSKYYEKNIGQLTYGRTGVDDFDQKTRIYPPAVVFVPDTKYKMVYLQATRQYAIFRELDDSNPDFPTGFSSKDINSMIKFFVKIGTKVKDKPPSLTDEQIEENNLNVDLVGE